jgi:DNA-binding response OmpR family regulator
MIHNPYQIMIVEDSETQALKLRLALEAQGWKVVGTADAEAALEEINHRLPDLIITDYHLPGMSGIDLCQRIRMNIDTRSTPILMFTVDESQAAHLRGLESGADDYISKSVDADILLLRIRTLLRKSQTQASVVGPGDAYFRKARLLAIDDSPTYLEFLSSELQREGYKVEKASGGREGLEKVHHETFDCVLVDLMMPEIDGVAVCRQLNELRHAMKNSSAVLILTARENKEDMTLGLEAGADDFVGKSSDMAVLKGRIRALLRRKFFQEENQRIIEELKSKELEAVRSRLEKEAAEAKAQLVDQLQQANRELQRENTERKRAEEEIKALNAELQLHASKLELANKELEAFSYSVSHDLRAPLRGIAGFTEVLATQYGARFDDAGRDYLGRVLAATKRMGELIDDMLQLSRVTRAEINRQTVDLSAIARAICQNLRETDPSRRVETVIADNIQAPGDAGLLRILLENLLGNAWKFTSKVPSPRIEFGVTQALGGGSCCFVRDNGAGFDMQYAAKLFGAFQRFHAADEFPGTGIGLAIVQRIISRHGGMIRAVSEVNKGATFYFSLEAAAPRT